MSVALLVYDEDAQGEAKRTMVPVATEDVFERVWLPGAEALGLRWVPLCQSGLPIRDPEERAELVAELERLGGWMEDRAADPNLRECLDRLRRLAEAVAALALPRQRGWIG